MSSQMLTHSEYARLNLPYVPQRPEPLPPPAPPEGTSFSALPGFAVIS